MTLLYITAEYQIIALFPVGGQVGDVRVLPGQARVVGDRAKIGAPPGWESTIAIVVESSTTPQDFGVLAQEGLTQVRGGQSARSPLWDLMCDATACLGDTRGVTVPRNLGQFAVKLVAWRTVEK